MKETSTNFDSQHKKKTRRRTSKLDKVYYTLANLILSNSLAKEAGRPTLSLDRIADALKKKHGIQIDKSNISRYLSKHSLLKAL